QPDRVEPDAHGIFALAKDDDIAHARHALDGVLHINIKVVGDELVGVACIAGKEPGGEYEVVADLGDGDAGLVHGRRQPSLNAGDAVLYVDCGDVEAVVRVEG